MKWKLQFLILKRASLTIFSHTQIRPWGATNKEKNNKNKEKLLNIYEK